MRSWWSWPKKPAPPAPRPVLSSQDARVLSAAGLTLPQWLALTDPERAALRWRVGLGSHPEA